MAVKEEVGRDVVLLMLLLVLLTRLIDIDDNELVQGGQLVDLLHLWRECVEETLFHVYDAWLADGVELLTQLTLTFAEALRLAV